MKLAKSITPTVLLLTITFLFYAPAALSQSMYTIRGQVLDDTGGWVQGALVRLYSEQSVRDLRADGDGKFEFTNLAKGTYELEGSSPGFKSVTVDFQIAEKAPETFSMILHVGSGSNCTVPQPDYDRVVAWLGGHVSYEKRSNKIDLAGVVRDQFDDSLSSVMVKLNKEGKSQETVSNEKGEFTFSGLEPGKYSLQSNHAGYRDLPIEVWITRENIVRAVVTMVQSWRVCGV